MADVPDGWPRPPAALLAAAVATVTALGVVGSGAQSVRRDRVDAGDLLALSRLGARVGPSASRVLLEPDGILPALLGAIGARDLAATGPADLEAMERVYLAVSAALSADPGADPAARERTALLLCAQLRPGLYPTGGRHAWSGLGLHDQQDHRTVWLVLRHVLQAPAVAADLHAVEVSLWAAARPRGRRAGGPGTPAGPPPPSPGPARR